MKELEIDNKLYYIDGGQAFPHGILLKVEAKVCLYVIGLQVNLYKL